MHALRCCLAPRMVKWKLEGEKTQISWLDHSFPMKWERHNMSKTALARMLLVHFQINDYRQVNIFMVNTMCWSWLWIRFHFWARKIAISIFKKWSFVGFLSECPSRNIRIKVHKSDVAVGIAFYLVHKFHQLRKQACLSVGLWLPWSFL